MMKGCRTDTVYLDFAKAFDKVDHNILLKKIKAHGISGKMGRWIQEFLRERKFRVVANGHMSMEADVVSGVPQGTVLAAVLFVVMISDIDEKVLNCVVRSFADDTRVNKMIKNEEDRVTLQNALDTIYEWARENKMKFNEMKFEQMTHGERVGVSIEPYKTASGEEIEIKSTVKDLGILASNDLLFREHINKVTSSCRVAMGIILRSFYSREKEPMMRLFNAYVRSKMEYCSVVWSPSEQTYINEIEKIQKAFTSRIEGVENMDYHERLKELKLYSLERRRERYYMIYGWQQMEGIKENSLKLKESERGTRLIISPKMPGEYDGVRISRSIKTTIDNGPARKTARLFNRLPRGVRRITGVTTKTFKGHLDEWLGSVPDEPGAGGYQRRRAAKTNSIIDQAGYKR